MNCTGYNPLMRYVMAPELVDDVFAQQGALDAPDILAAGGSKWFVTDNGCSSWAAPILMLRDGYWG